ncbi:MAG: DUF2723 domain-containing protein [Anaerolineales bacterium]|nr:DUF2723 domain-containing protein [Anaerolineales bacterium]
MKIFTRPIIQKSVPILIMALIPLLYLLTMARTLVLGDPTEYTFIANRLGIAHPPGYAFITVVGKLFQTVIPFGGFPWRMHLLSAVAASLAAFFVFGTIRTLAANLTGLKNLSGLGTIAAIFGALTVGTTVDIWQHAIHANPHIITATFLMANLYFLTRWWAVQKDGEYFQPSNHPAIQPSNKWLYTFCVSAGLGVAHHPLTVFAFPGYALFILLVRPSILRNWHTLLKMVGFALLGLSLFLYYPLRSSSAPFGPTTMNTLNGFLDHVLARGLSESLPYFTLAEQPQRQIVLWSIVHLQYALPLILLAVFALTLPFFLKNDKVTITSPPYHPIILYITAFLATTAFVISLRAQDIMAYMLGPLMVIGLLAGIGFWGLLVLVQRRFQLDWQMVGLLGTAVFLFGPGLQIARNAPRVSLRSYSEGDDYVNAVFERFEGTGEGATLLNDWERMTPLWYTQLVDKRWPDPSDVTPVFVSTGGSNPWQEGIFANGLPLYFSNFRPDAIAGTDFRLRPDGPFYQVLEPGNTSIPAILTRLDVPAGEIEVVGYEVGETATAGDFVRFTLAMRTPAGTDDFYVPVLYVGEMRFEFTTDSHLTTPRWWENEVIVERFDFALPHDLAAGSYPLMLNIKNLSRDEELLLDISLGSLMVEAQQFPIATDHLLANFRQRVGLVQATVSGGNAGTEGGRNGRFTAPWPTDQSFTVKRGDVLNINLTWESLARAEESYTVFVHLIDPGNVPHISLDYTPLGGSMPTHLWIPKWLPGQRMIDPYRMEIPDTLPPGTYFIEVGLYEMIGNRRLHISDPAGNLTGDRYILGAVQIE